MRSLLLLLAIPATLAVTTGCNKVVGGAIADTTNKVVLPATMAFGDIGVGCASGEGLGFTVVGYGGFSKKAERASVLALLSAGMCLDEDVWEASLDVARATRAGDIALAKDAMAREARAHLVAARRNMAAFEALRSAYGVPGPDGECPKLKKDEDQLSYMLGLSSGVLAVVHDLAADGRAGVSLAIPAEVVRGAACLDDDRWWGVPKAMQASVWALLPDAPGAGDPWKTFSESVAKGKAAKVRLAGAFQAQTLAVLGMDAELREAIHDHATTVREVPGDPTWRMLDVYGTAIVTQESDLLWTEAVGYRTPYGELGAFPGDAPATPAVDEALLDDLDLE